MEPFTWLGRGRTPVTEERATEFAQGRMVPSPEEGEVSRHWLPVQTGPAEVVGVRYEPVTRTLYLRYEDGSVLAVHDISIDAAHEIVTTSGKNLEEVILTHLHYIVSPPDDALPAGEEGALGFLAGGRWVTVASSNVQKIRYFHEQKLFKVLFYSGFIYSYSPVDGDLALTVYEYFSKGKAVWQYLRGLEQGARQGGGALRRKSPFPDAFKNERERLRRQRRRNP